MKYLSGKKFIIFDFDGVLVNTSKFHSLAFEEVFKEFDIKNFSYVEFAGMKTEDVIFKVLENEKVRADQKLIERLSLKKRSLARSLIQKYLSLENSLEETLKTLSEDFILAIGSSASRKNLDCFFSKIDRNIFKAVFTGDDIKNSKPNPEVFLEVLRELGANKKESIIIEDSLAGVYAGNRAGVDVIGVTSSLSKEKLIKIGAKCTIEKVIDLL